MSIVFLVLAAASAITGVIWGVLLWPRVFEELSELGREEPDRARVLGPILGAKYFSKRGHRLAWMTSAIVAGGMLLALVFVGLSGRVS